MKSLIRAALLLLTITITHVHSEVLFDWTAKTTNQTIIIPNLGARYGVVVPLPIVDPKFDYQAVCRLRRWTQVFRFATLEDLKSSTFTVQFYRRLQDFYNLSNQVWSQDISGQDVTYDLVGSDTGAPIYRISCPIRSVNIDVTHNSDPVVAVKVTEIQATTRVHYVLWHTTGNSHAAGMVSGVDVTGPIGPPHLACALEADFIVRRATIQPPVLTYQGNLISWRNKIPGSSMEQANSLLGPWSVVQDYESTDQPVFFVPPSGDPSSRFFRLSY